ncbi:MAG: cytochrome c, partial [Chlorobia bacterium]|nr:cytochrome c [Fimbriimonadaceae bacterium]
MYSHRIRIGFLAASSLPLIYAAVAPQRATPGKAETSGASFFAKSCAPCHGVKGEGGAGFPRPLTGPRTVTELSKFIAQSMPPGPKKTPPAQAKLIAEFMHGAFYSPLAQEKNRPARVTLSRLTVRQFRNAVADLVGPYHPVVPSTSGGLKGEYFKNRDRSAKNRVIERIDPEIKFDFGTTGPAPGQVEAHNYS